MCVVGTRPDAIKTAPVVLELRRFPSLCETLLIATGQHREMLAQALDAFDLAADRDLAIMSHGQTLAEVTTRALDGLDSLIAEMRPDMIFAQGDTTTTFVASLAAFYRGVPFGHIEAGLRTESVAEPFPEEFNRRATALVARHHYAPTSWAAQNLFAERVDPHHVFVTGNTGIDAVLHIAGSPGDAPYAGWTGPLILLTTHRRENWGEPQAQIARAARRLLDRFPEARLCVAMHRNPSVRATLSSVLGDHPRADLIEPPAYPDFVRLMRRSTLILSDSGGVQEEAPAFGVPVLVLRETTERPEGVQAGVAKLVGVDEERVFAESERLLANPEARAGMSRASSPYGDGRAAARIRWAALRLLGFDSPEETMWT